MPKPPRYNSIGYNRAQRILSNAFGARTISEVAKRMGWKQETLYQVLIHNPEVHDAVRYLISLTAECEFARDAARWAERVRKRLR